MTLPPGTALHHGKYVVDAFSAEDAIGPIYLATHIPSGRWVQLRILGSRNPEKIPYPEVRKAFYNYLLMVQAFNHPLFSGHLAGFEDTAVCYQVLDANLGQPLSRIVSRDHPVSPRQSVAWVRQVAHGLIALKPLGWQGLTLTPDQFWQRPHQTVLTFTGFDLPGAASLAPAQQEALVVKGLSYLLYFLLTGKRAEHSPTPLAVDVRQQIPAMPYALDTALQVGSHQELSRVSMDLQQWLDLLPDGDNLPDHPVQAPPLTAQGAARPSPSLATYLPQAAEPSPPVFQIAGADHPSRVPTTESNVHVLHATSGQPSRSRFRKFAPAALVLTALVASFSGLGLGLMARFQPTVSDRSSSVRLDPEQSFPPLSDWSGDDPIPAWEYSPDRRDLPDYGDSAPSPAVVVPEAVAQPTSLPTADNEPSSPPGSEEEISQDPELDLALPQEDGFFEDREPFTAEPIPRRTDQPAGEIPTDKGNPVQPEDTPREAPAPIESEPESTAPPAPLAPKPLSAPVPLPSSPPSAPAPSTS